MAPECAATTIEPHEHHVRLTLLHSELNATYGLRTGLATSIRLPYDIKQQRVRYTTLGGDPFAPPYGDIHHRSETLRGLSDGSLLLRWAPSGSEWQFAAGTTLPFGETVEDPIALGRAGLKHQHLQFGSGVFAPELEATWRRPFGQVVASALLQATLPLTSNSHGYQAPKNFRWTIGPSFRVARVGVAVSAAGQYQTVATWHGEADEGTGFTNGGVRVQLALLPVGGVRVSPSLYHELYSRGFHDEKFSQGPTVSVTLTRSF